MAAYLSGVSTALRFSAEGRLTLGRLTPGRYRLIASSGPTVAEREIAVTATEGVAIEVP